MPNTITNQTLIDSTRRVRVHLTGSFDGASGQESNVIKVNTWGLAGALSLASNNRQLLSGNGNPRSSYNVSIDRIEYSIAGGGQVALAWQGSTNTNFAILSGSGELGGDARGTDLALTQSAPAPTGNIVLSTLGVNANGSYTVTIDMKKDPVAFDQGQIQNPKDFNVIIPGVING